MSIADPERLCASASTSSTWTRVARCSTPSATARSLVPRSPTTSACRGRRSGRRSSRSARGFAVESTPEGYVAPERPGYSAAGIEFGLDAPYAVEYYDRLSSTNDRARELAGTEPTGSRSSPTSRPVAGDGSTASGRAQRRRLALADDRPDAPPARAPLFTLAAAVAIVDACREAGVNAHIKAERTTCL